MCSNLIFTDLSVKLTVNSAAWNDKIPAKLFCGIYLFSIWNNIFGRVLSALPLSLCVGVWWVMFSSSRVFFGRWNFNKTKFFSRVNNLKMGDDSSVRASGWLTKLGVHFFSVSYYFDAVRKFYIYFTSWFLVPLFFKVFFFSVKTACLKLHFLSPPVFLFFLFLNEIHIIIHGCVVSTEY